MRNPESLKILIHASITPGLAGGVAQATRELIHILGRLDDGTEEYRIFVETADQKDWLQSALGSNQSFVEKPKRAPSPTKPRTLSALARPVRRIARRVLGIYNETPPEPPLAISDGFYENQKCDVVHFPFQSFVLCGMPMIFNPHDIQHLHFPQFFDATEVARREAVYSNACRFAQTVIVGSQWVKEDIERHYAIHPGKIQVIPEAPQVQLSTPPPREHIEAVKAKYQLESPFAFFPGVTWQHKNHVRLIEALARLRDSRGQMVRLVCSGSRYAPHWPRVQACVETHRLSSQVKFIGFVPDEDLKALYQMAEFLIMPSLFEASSLPVFEAWAAGLPVASSNATALPDQNRDAVREFDPVSVESIADAIAGMAGNKTAQQDLRERGFQRLKDFDWKRTAKAYRAVYRRAALRSLTDEDRELLSWDWMRNPRRTQETTK